MTQPRRIWTSYKWRWYTCSSISTSESRRPWCSNRGSNGWNESWRTRGIRCCWM